MQLKSQLAALFGQAITDTLGEEYASADPVLQYVNNPKFGDMQANFAMGLAKKAGKPPRDIAQQVVAALPENDLIESMEVAGPGFVNITLNTEALANMLAQASADERLGLLVDSSPQLVVVDYSSPNVAKEMHVGHLRSTVIGDSIARLLAFKGHTVIRQNHVGDWGTQFGMLIVHLEETPEEKRGGCTITELYQQAKQRFDQEPGFADLARQRVVELQAGEEQAVSLWKQLCAMSETHFQDVYSRLGVSLTTDDIRGESAYNDMLPEIVTDLRAQGALTEDQGAQVLFPEGFKKEDGSPLPMIVQKADGGYLYATTDLAAARYRVSELKADRIIYVTDARQSQHFAMVFEALKKVGWQHETSFEHVPFGMVLGADKKPFKTRDGGTVKLIDLIEEAESRATDLVSEKNPSLSKDECDDVGRTVGIGCLKYADLSGDRIKDYVFDWKRMVSFEGNTAAYIQYSYTRARSILRQGDYSGTASFVLVDPLEKQLALKLSQLPEVLAQVERTLEPHRLCTYLYELAAFSHRFYEACPVLKADSDAVRQSRLAMCDLMARQLEIGLRLLGIGVLERM